MAWLRNSLRERATRDFCVMAVLSIAVIYLAISVEAFEHLVEFSKSHESWQLDEIFVVLMVLPFALITYSLRRLQETRAALKERAAAEQRANDMALHDALTGLPNRRKATLELKRLVRSADKTTVAVLAIDLNRFKPVNDLNGHATGDQLLIAVADRLKSVVGDKGNVHRMGGDEFLVTANIENASSLIGLARSASAVFETPFKLENSTCAIGASIGVASTADHRVNPDDLVAMADAAMYRCKSAGRNGYAFFEDGMEIVARGRAKIEAELRDAIAAGKIEAHYQPLVNLGTDEIVGFEALARWRLPDGSYRMPNDFISVAEESGLISELFFCILRQSCLEARNWPPHIGVSINLSPVQFADEWLVGRILGVLVETGMSPGRLEIEITENALVGDFENARRVVNELRAQRIHIALDDFGTGYSSLRHLSELLFDNLKIDRAFIHNVDRNATSEAIVRAVASLAHDLGLTVTAEGIETEENAVEVGKMGCDIGQGYHFGRPVKSGHIQTVRTPAKFESAKVAGGKG